MTTSEKRWNEVIRTVRLRPYTKGNGPAFYLQLIDFGSLERIAYRFAQIGSKAPIFEGQDFKPSPLHAWDSNETVKALLGFLTVCQGDVDSEYFDNYSEAQKAFRDEHAEALSIEVYSRFGE